MITEKSQTIADICRVLASEDVEAAADVARNRYPFAPEPITQRRYGPTESTRVFLRDGFVDRYSGDLLIYPPVLRVLSQVLPAEFPHHPYWKTDETHPSYWEVGATIDHLVPVTRGGVDDESNWFTTSMARNSAKMNWTLEELGWELQSPGSLSEWDGAFRWFIEYGASHPDIREVGNVRQWYRAATLAADEL